METEFSKRCEILVPQCGKTKSYFRNMTPRNLVSFQKISQDCTASRFSEAGRNMFLRSY
jgi:hypothetical protein